MTGIDDGHGGLRAELDRALAERDQALSELAELKARLTAQDIAISATAAQPVPPPKERHLRLIKGGVLGAAILGGVEWLRRHREVTVALVAVVAGIAGGAAAWMIWPDRGGSPSGRPPAQMTTATVTSTATATRPAVTVTQMVTVTGSPSPAGRATVTRTLRLTMTPPAPTAVRESTRATPTRRPTTAPASTVAVTETVTATETASPPDGDDDGGREQSAICVSAGRTPVAVACAWPGRVTQR